MLCGSRLYPPSVLFLSGITLVYETRQKYFLIGTLTKIDQYQAIKVFVYVLAFSTGCFLASTGVPVKRNLSYKQRPTQFSDPDPILL